MNPKTKARIRAILLSKAVWGALLAGGAWLFRQPTIDVPNVLEALGMVVSAIGVRDAIQQNHAVTAEVKATVDDVATAVKP